MNTASKKRSERSLLPVTIKPYLAAFTICLTAAFFSACSELESKKPDNYFAATAPPAVRELRWSNGSKPRSLDPALAVSPPETDIVRAMFEGLTELDSRSLEVIPAAASSWRSNADATEWTFDLRPEARWSNGRPVTAEDFVRSWKRAATIGTNSSNKVLFENITGFDKLKTATGQRLGEQVLSGQTAAGMLKLNISPAAENSDNSVSELGVKAVSEKQLTIKLHESDRDFPKLVAHTVFRPTYENNAKDPFIEEISNGAFRLETKDESEVKLLRSDEYWDHESVHLDSVKFVATRNAEHALEEYREGRVDIVTNAELAPLALKILSAYDDFRRTPHAALNFYEVNVDKPPFDDIRVREALAISIDRERIITGEMDGAGEPALSLSPFSARTTVKIAEDRTKARDLIERAGFPAGEGFPVIRLVINRNDMQQRIAKSIAKMWQDELNVRTEITVIEGSEMEAARQNKEFDLIRRGVVFRTASEQTNLHAVYGKKPADDKQDDLTAQTDTDTQDADNRILLGDETGLLEFEELLTEADSQLHFQIIPIHFPESFALVKPYISEFYLNSLDAHLLNNVKIDNGWINAK